MIELENQTNTVVSSTVEVQSETFESADVIPKSHVVEFEDNNFVLSNEATSGLANGSIIPDWMNQAISDRIASGTSSFSDVLNDFKNVLRQVETGVNQNILELQTEVRSEYALTTTVAADLAGNSADQLITMNSLVTDSESRTSQTYIANSDFNTVASAADSFVVQQNTTMSNEIGTNASAIEGLSSVFTDLNSSTTATANILETFYTEAGVNPDTGELFAGAGFFGEMNASIAGATVKLISSEGVAIGDFPHWDHVENPKVGMLVEYDLEWWQYVGGTNTQIEGVWGWIPFDYTSVAQQIAELKSQVDGKISSWFYSYLPSSTNYPWNTWLDQDELNGNVDIQIAHLGDLFYDFGNEKAYKFINNNTVEEPEYMWEEVFGDILTTLATAYSTKAAADGNITQIRFASKSPDGILGGDGEIGEYEPVAEGDGDLWIDPDNSNVTKVWNNGVWEDTSNSDAADSIDWALGASKMQIDPVTGDALGWEYHARSDGTKQDATDIFRIRADRFAISDGHALAEDILTIEDGDAVFKGKVTFGNITDVPVNMMPNAFSLLNGTNITTEVSQVANGYVQRRDYGGFQKYGGATLLLRATNEDCHVLLSNTSEDAYNVKCAKDVELMISMWVKLNAGDGKTAMYIYPSGGGSSIRISNTTVPSNNVWHRVYGTFTPSTTSFALRVDNDSYAGSESVMAIDGVMVEVRGSLTEPSPFVEGSQGLANSSMSNVTTIDGGKITTGIIQHQSSGNYFNLNNGTARFSKIGGGFILDSEATGVSESTANIKGAWIEGGTINGGTVYGGEVIGSIIAATNIRIKSRNGVDQTGKVSHEWDSPYNLTHTFGSVGDSFNLNSVRFNGPLIGSGFSMMRVCDHDQTNITLWTNVFSSGGTSKFKFSYQYTNNGTTSSWIEFGIEYVIYRDVVYRIKFPFILSSISYDYITFRAVVTEHPGNGDVYFDTYGYKIDNSY